MFYGVAALDGGARTQDSVTNLIVFMDLFSWSILLSVWGPVLLELGFRTLPSVSSEDMESACSLRLSPLTLPSLVSSFLTDC